MKIPHRSKLPAGVRKSVTFAVRLLDGSRQARCMRSKPGEFITATGVDALLKMEADRVEECFPGREFRLVRLSDGNFNFVEVKINILEVKSPPEAAFAAQTA